MAPMMYPMMYPVGRTIAISLASTYPRIFSLAISHNNCFYRPRCNKFHTGKAPTTRFWHVFEDLALIWVLYRKENLSQQSFVTQAQPKLLYYNTGCHNFPVIEIFFFNKLLSSTQYNKQARSVCHRNHSLLYSL